MKTKINHIFFFSLTFFGLTFFSNCKRNDSSGCPGATPSYYYLSDDDKNKIPYKNTDTIIFINYNAGDTVKLIGQGNQNYFVTTVDAGGNPDCPKSPTNYENLLYYFKSNDVNLKEIVVDYYIAKGTFNQNGEGDHYADFILKTDQITRTFSSRLNYLNGQLPVPYKDKIIINGATLYGISLTSFEDSTATLFYNLTNGILKIQISNNQSWLKQ